MNDFGSPTIIIDQVDATTPVVAAVDRADLHEAIESVRWQRRGLLQRLIQADRPENLRFDTAS
jgi:hypothetical protein